MANIKGWDERDYKLWSAIGCLQSYGRLNRTDHLVSLHEVEEVIKQHAEDRYAKEKETSGTLPKMRRTVSR